MIGTVADPYAPLRIAAFRWLVLSLLPSTLAQQIQAVVVGWQIYALTHDPLALGLIGLSEALPFIAVALFAGHVADRLDRRRITLLSLAVMLLCAGTLFVLSFRLTPHQTSGCTQNFVHGLDGHRKKGDGRSSRSIETHYAGAWRQRRGDRFG